jgi:hypothetical protein
MIIHGVKFPFFSDFVMEPTKENLHFFVETCKRNEMSASETHGFIVRAWGNVICDRTVRNWFHTEPQTPSISDQPSTSAGRPRSSRTADNTETIHTLVASNPHITIEELLVLTGISHGTVHTILHQDLQFKSVLSRWVPHFLTDSQRQERVAAAKSFLAFFQKHRRTLAHQLVVVDEKWLYFRDIGTKASNRAWVPATDDTERPTVPRRIQHERKCMLMVAFCFDGKFFVHILPHGDTINGDTYLDFLKKVHHSFHRRTTNQLDWHETVLQHDNARPHVKASVSDYLKDKGVALLHQPPWSPDFNILDRWLFARIENSRRGINFLNEKEVQAHVTADFNTITQDELKHAFDKFKTDMHMTVDRGGVYP